MTCDHITIIYTVNGGVCKRCGEPAPPAEMWTDEDWDRARERAALDCDARDRLGSNLRACRTNDQNREAFGDGSWSDGRLIPHLDPRDPDRRVTSEKQMREVYDKNGICMDTAEIRDREKFEKRLTEVRKKNRKPGWNKKQSGSSLKKSKT